MAGEDHTPETDEALMEAVGRGEAAAARRLSERKRPRLIMLAHRFLRDPAEAEDVAQETLLRTWAQASLWQAGRARIDTWMYTVARNLCLDRLRRRRPEVPVETLSIADDQPAPGARLEAHQTAQRVRSALDALPPRQREAIMLQYYQEMSQTEAARTMGISVEALESLLSRARRALKVGLSPAEDMSAGRSAPQRRRV